MVTNVRVASASSSIQWEKKNPTTNGADAQQGQHLSITTPSKPSLLSIIQPWFDPSVYPFLPSPLNYLLVVLIPLVIPAIFLVVGAFSVQRVTSTIRIRRHLFNRKKTSATIPVSSSPATESPDAVRDLEAQIDTPQRHINPPSVFFIDARTDHC